MLLSCLITARSFSLIEEPWQTEPRALSRYPDRFADKQDYRESLRAVTYQVRPGDTLHQILMKHGVDSREAAALAAAGKPHWNPRQLRNRECLELLFLKEPARLEKVRCHDGEGRVLTIGRTPWGWVASTRAEPEFVTIATAEGTVRGSLYRSAADEGIDHDLAFALADIFAWDIDFLADLRNGDRYSLLYEQRFRNGVFVGNGRILAARFNNAGTRHEAYLYEVPGTEAGYYDRDGRSLRREFLKSPLRYTRISSGFSRSRLHPIFKVCRPHFGIDYAAPVGTPVATVGDGRVVSAGWNKGFGRCVEIRHNGSYSSAYGHLSRFAPGVRPGAAVKQGQIIGYVGCTGWATGPHLDFRFKRDGRPVNPMQVRFPTADPVPRQHLAAFGEHVARLEGELLTARTKTDDTAPPGALAASSKTP
ncbi:MAG TPA: M23 family metallopeptidase [Syntrophobacteria bacterium]|nr:M23 family metallopeptidase [Syntrophobacteria bacterium]